MRPRENTADVKKETVFSQCSCQVRPVFSHVTPAVNQNLICRKDLLQSQGAKQTLSTQFNILVQKRIWQKGEKKKRKRKCFILS